MELTHDSVEYRSGQPIVDAPTGKVA